MKEQSNALIVFTPLAWTKMWLLVDHFNSEVAWAAVCERGEKEHSYIVKDVIVHDQTVTGGTVRTDPAEYDEWLDWYRENDEETFFKISLHAHSHYVMAAFPSGLDTALQKDIISQLDGDMFYIFMIVNRRRDMWIRIVDHADGTTFLGRNVQWCVIDDGFHSSSFINEAKEKVKERKPERAHKHTYIKNEEEEDEDGSGEES